MYGPFDFPANKMAYLFGLYEYKFYLDRYYVKPLNGFYFLGVNVGIRNAE